MLGCGRRSSIKGLLWANEIERRSGGELLIPTMIFIFGADIKTAGSASILISLGVVLMGIWRYWRLDAMPKRRQSWRKSSSWSPV
jgi:hypothetical protein